MPVVCATPGIKSAQTLELACSNDALSYRIENIMYDPKYGQLPLMMNYVWIRYFLNLASSAETNILCFDVKIEGLTKLMELNSDFLFVESFHDSLARSLWHPDMITSSYAFPKQYSSKVVKHCPYYVLHEASCIHLANH